MKTQKHQSSVTKLFISHVMTAIIAVMISGIYVITDGMFVGHYLGKDGLAAVGIAYPVFMVLPGIGLMLGIGGGALISIHRGANNVAASAITFTTSLTLIVLLSLISFLFLQLSSDFLLHLQSVDLQILTMGAEYLAVYTYSALLVVASSALTLYIRNDNSPNIAMCIMVTGALLNIFFNYLLLGVLSLGIAGAAYASVISMTVVCLCCIGYFYSSICSSFIKFERYKFDRALACSILLTGSSVLAMYLYSGFVMAVHNKLFSQYGNSSSLSAFSIVGYLMAIYYMLAEGIGNGVQPLISFFHGQKSSFKKRQLLNVSMLIVALLGVCYYVLLNMYSLFFINLFNSDIDVVTKATTGLNYHLTAMFLEGIIIIASVYFSAIQRGATALFIAIANMLVQLPLLYFLPKIWGEFGVWLALPISNVVMILLIAPLLFKAVMSKDNHSNLQINSYN
ncbi:MAG: MATE family efflux transporter [Oceanospirillaceae bacterium]